MLDDTDKKWIKKELINGIVDALEQVVLPRMDKLEIDVVEMKEDISDMKEDISGMKEDISDMKGDIESLDNRLSKVEKKVDVVIDHQAEKIDIHEKRIGKLELTIA